MNVDITDVTKCDVIIAEKRLLAFRNLFVRVANFFFHFSEILKYQRLQKSCLFSFISFWFWYTEKTWNREIVSTSCHQVSLTHFSIRRFQIFETFPEKTFNHLRQNFTIRSGNTISYRCHVHIHRVLCWIQNAKFFNRDIPRGSSQHFLKLLIRLLRGDARHILKLSLNRLVCHWSSVSKNSTSATQHVNVFAREHNFCARYISIHTC